MRTQAHPLSVHVRVPTDAAGRPVQLRLHWLPALRLVTARCGDPADDVALSRLFDGDAGLAVPFEATHLAAGGNLVWDPARPDRPYRWGLARPLGLAIIRGRFYSTQRWPLQSLQCCAAAPHSTIIPVVN